MSSRASQHILLCMKRTSIKLCDYQVWREKEEKQNCEISYIDRIRSDTTVYIESHNLFIILKCRAQNVQGDLD